MIKEVLLHPKYEIVSVDTGFAPYIDVLCVYKNTNNIITKQ